MPIPSYLTTSRHGLHYFRFPIPATLHPERKQSCIRMSLDTRCPREALHLARESRLLFVLCDAIGLVAFAITGALVASVANAPFFGYIMLAFLTATGGAILRDILVNNVPEVLHSGFYGSIAVLVAAIIYLLDELDCATPTHLLIVAISGVLLRLLAYHHRWQLPKS